MSEDDEHHARRIPLERPALPVLEERLEWPSAVSVMGRGAEAFADAIASSLRALGVDAHVLRVELRRAAGASVSGGHDAVIHAHPDALIEALAPLVAAHPVAIGVGPAFAAAVRAEHTIWIRGAESAASLGPTERALAAEATLILEEPRPGVARALAERLAAGGAEAEGL